MFHVSHVEFILLSLIHEHGKITGYKVNRLITERGYREWADIGTTSVYNGLKKLKEKTYVASATDRYKKGKGPKGVNYSTTPEGLELLKKEVREGLATGRGRGGQFMLAVSALPVISQEDIIEALTQRITNLRQDFERVQQKYERQKAYLPFHGELLFQYSLFAIEREIEFTKEMVSEVKNETHYSEF